MRIGRIGWAAAALALGACAPAEKPLDNGAAVAGGDGAISLAQGWSADQQQRAWFDSFGSRLIPTAWLQALERPEGAQRFADAAYLDAFGFLVQSPTAANPQGFPVGFTQTRAPDGTAWTGLGCAACHTGEVRYKGKRVRLDGGQGMLDFNGFEAAIVQALSATANDPDRFERFAHTLNVPAEAQPKLKDDVAALAAKLDKRHNMNAAPVPYGHGRLDAFGQIFNAVASDFLNLPENRRVPDAPVSYPVLWDAPHLDVVQWNGSAPNDGPGPLLQNVTTALAVYGGMDVNVEKGLDGYPSSVDFDRLGEIEDDLYALTAPPWPAALFGALDAARVQRGSAVYARECQSCHALSDRSDGKRKLHATLTPVAEVGTDARMADNFLAANGKTGAFEGRKEGVVAGPVFGATANTPDLVVHAAVGAALRHPLAAVREAVTGYHKVYKAAVDAQPDHYKARPLSGIWASAPYLHNGSVPSLTELLKPPAQRATSFYVGSREYDPVAVGVAVDVQTNASRFDTALAGNSNAGHVYGTALDAETKKDLLEYLKSL